MIKNEMVFHTFYGAGYATELDTDSITVTFANNSVKTFAFPEVIRNNLLTFDNQSLQNAALEVLADFDKEMLAKKENDYIKLCRRLTNAEIRRSGLTSMGFFLNKIGLLSQYNKSRRVMEKFGFLSWFDSLMVEDFQSLKLEYLPCRATEVEVLNHFYPFYLTADNNYFYNKVKEDLSGNNSFFRTEASRRKIKKLLKDSPIEE